MKMRFFRSGFYFGKRLPPKQATHTNLPEQWLQIQCRRIFNGNTRTQLSFLLMHSFLVVQSLQISWNPAIENTLEN